MSTLLKWLLIGAGLFIVWQWWISRRNTVLHDADERRRTADAAGRSQENLGLAARPRLADPESLWQLPAILDGDNPLWSQIFGDGTVNNSEAKVPRPPEVNPFIFGYGKN